MLEIWASTEERQRLWAKTCPHLLVERVCYAMTHTQATRYGLVVSNQGAILWSTFSAGHFKRLQSRYEEVITNGLCFWVEDRTLRLVAPAEFLAFLPTLPAPAIFRHTTRKP